MVNKALLDLFAPVDQGVGFRQGTVTAWDSDTGENTIEVAGGILTNVAILNTSEAIALQAGHTVGLLTFNGSWFILGRITKPTDPDFASASTAFQTVAAQTSNFAVPVGPSFTEIVSTSLDVPAWADEALVTVSVSMSLLQDTVVGGDFGYMYAAISGVTSGAVGAGFPKFSEDNINSFVSFSHTHTAVVSGSGPATIAVQGFAQSQGSTWAAQGANRAFLAASAVYRSNV